MRTARPPRARKQTVDDYRRTPEGFRFQLVDGEIIESPTPPVRHQVVLGHVAFNLFRHVKRWALGTAVHLVNVFLSHHDAPLPDVVFVSRAHRHRIREDGAYGPPDLVVEILAPSTRRLDLGKKRRLYARSGVKELWLVDPDRSSVDVWRFAEDARAPAARLGRRDRLRTPLLPRLSIKLADVFAP